MKRIVVILFLFVICITNFKCAKEQNTGCQPVSPQSEESAILNYAAANGIVATRHSSGLYYQVLSEGSGANPTTSNVVGVTYSGKTTGNVVFDQSTVEREWPLSVLIEGWQIGIPLIKKGGNIILLVPSSMAYGCRAQPGIPANSVLIFNVNLVNVK